MQFPLNKKSITLIGMAGAGKSFIGRNLAKLLQFKFVDTDDLIEQTQKQGLQDILDKIGDKKFIELETQIIINLENIQNKIISPGGSVIYSPQAMEFLKNNSVVIYLADSYSHILNRIKNLNSRGIVGLKGNSFEQLYLEREKLYNKFADITIDMAHMQTGDKYKKAKEVTEKIIEEIEKLN